MADILEGPGASVASLALHINPTLDKSKQFKSDKGIPERPYNLSDAGPV